MTAKDLIKKWRLTRVARVRIEDGKRLVIDKRDPEAVKQLKCIYAFLIAGKVRVGSSKAKLDNRLTRYEKDFTRALNGETSSTPSQEAKRWKRSLPAGSFGFIYARPGTIVKTPLGEISAYLDEESEMIGELGKRLHEDQILNRNKHR
jgi:hypothetical protein